MLYVDPRVGVGEREFGMLKFRTMVAGAAEQQPEVEELNEASGALFKIRDDPRVTRVGRVLRRLSIDELPQLANVLRGQMSLVGPRPLPLRDHELLDDWHKARCLVLPGMTGPMADLGPVGPLLRRPRAPRLHLPRELVGVARRVDHPEDDPRRAQRARRVLVIPASRPGALVSKRRISYRFPESRLERLLSRHLSNAQYNRLVWTLYPLLRRGLGRPAPAGGSVGSEWGSRAEVEWAIEEYIYPYVTTSSAVAEIGVGGGRLASLVAGRVGTLTCFDISETMLRQARAALRESSNVRFVKLDGGRYPPQFDSRFEFIYAFDVFVHLDLHSLWRAIASISRMLIPGGRAFVHTSNLAAPDGWKQFASQPGYSVSGHYFIAPQIVEILASRAGLEIVRASSPDPSVPYLNRDFLAILRKPFESTTS